MSYHMYEAPRLSHHRAVVLITYHKVPNSDLEGLEWDLKTILKQVVRKHNQRNTVIQPPLSSHTYTQLFVLLPHTQILTQALVNIWSRT